MKAKKQIFVLFLTMLVGIPILFAQNKKEQKSKRWKLPEISLHQKTIGSTWILIYIRIEIPYYWMGQIIRLKLEMILSFLLFFISAKLIYHTVGEELNFSFKLL